MISRAKGTSRGAAEVLFALLITSRGGGRNRTAPAHLQHDVDLDKPFRGSEAIAAGLATRRRLRGPGFRELGRDTYVAAGVELDDRLRARAAALEVPGAVLGGWSAVVLHGVDAAPEGAPIELVVGARHLRRAHSGKILRQDVLGEHEVVRVGGVRVTSPIRTGVDLASRADHVAGVIAVDALAHHFGFRPEELLDHPVLRDNPRGRRRLLAAVADADARAESPPETRTRLLLRAASDIPDPIPQLVVCDDRGRFVGRVDFGWRELRTALEYQGDHHRVDKKQWRRDAVRTAELAAAGWLVLPITAHDLFVDRRGFVVRVGEALARRARELGVPFR